jgi:hypothetical protein
MWVSGIMQGLMWRAYTSLGFLEYSFVETVEAMHPYYIIRAARRRCCSSLGALIMAYNLWRRCVAATAEEAEARPRPSSLPSGGGADNDVAHPNGQARKIFEKNSIILIVGILSWSPSAASSRSRRCSTSRARSRR